MWGDKKSLEELIVANLFNVAPSDKAAAMLAAKDRCYEGLTKHHIDNIFSFVQLSKDRRNPYPDLLQMSRLQLCQAMRANQARPRKPPPTPHKHWEADHFGNRPEVPQMEILLSLPGPVSKIGWRNIEKVRHKVPSEKKRRRQRGC